MTSYAIDKIRLSSGGEIHYEYTAQRETLPAHPTTQKEAYRVCSSYQALANDTEKIGQRFYSYDLSKLDARSATITYAGRPNYTERLTYNRRGDFISSEATNSDSGDTYWTAVNYTYRYTVEGTLLPATMVKSVKTYDDEEQPGNTVTEAYTYDNYHRLTEIARDSEVIEKLTYDDAFGMPLTRFQKRGANDWIGYSNDLSEDKKSVLKSYIATSNDAGAITTREVTKYTYDRTGNIMQMAVGLTSPTQSIGVQAHQVITYAYDALGNPASVTDALGQTAGFQYSILGELARETDRNGTEKTYVYDGLGRVKSITAHQGEETDAISYTYNYLGQPLSMIDSSGTTVYTYNGRGDLATECKNGITKSYTYDANGNRTSFSSDVTERQTYAFDWANRLQKTTVGGTVTSYTYDANGNVKTSKTASGSTTLAEASYSYNNANLRLARPTRPDGGTLAHIPPPMPPTAIWLQ